MREVPIRDYAAIGDGRTVALVGRDASVDWLCLPDLDSPSVFGSLLDRRRGGRFALAPDVPYRATRRYVRDTNVLETTFATGDGEVRVVDAMALPASGLEPERALVRRVDARSGRVPMRWSVDPRFGYGLARTRVSRRAGVPVATSGADAVGICSWDAGDVVSDGERVCGAFIATPGAPATFALVAAHQEPLVLPRREHVERSLESTTQWWRRWADGLAYDGAWHEAVVRSALTLQLLVHAPTGALAAAATTSLPEDLGGERNWDYRYCWVRDSAFTLDALLALGCAPEADAFFWWLMHASQLTQPRLQVLYRLDGGARARERVLPLSGYARSTPVRVGNGAVDQLQLDVYGDLLHTAWRYAGTRGTLDDDVGRRLARIADHVCDIWRTRDAGLWEVRSAPQHFTQSKMMCCIALERACALAASGMLPARSAARWAREAAAIRVFVDGECWSSREQSYTRAPDTDELDAGVLLGALFGFAPPGDARMASTVDAVCRRLGDGPFVRRYTGVDGLEGDEGAFLACSFWLAEALARDGRVDDAAATMDALVGLANDVGLYAEEVDPSSGAFLGNFPQALTHLALVNTAVAIDRAGAS